MSASIHGGLGILGLCMAVLGCGLSSGPGEAGDRPGGLPSATESGAYGERSHPEATASPAGGSSYCRARFGSHPAALDGCQRYATESYQRLEPVFRRASLDSMSMESKRLEGCMRRYDGPLGVDWMLVEHCFSRGLR